MHELCQAVLAVFLLVFSPSGWVFGYVGPNPVALQPTAGHQNVEPNVRHANLTVVTKAIGAQGREEILTED